MLFERKYTQFLKQEETWKENSGKIFEKLSSHCSPTMKTKLRGMQGWTEIEDMQDGIKMVKLLHRVYFDTDGSKQSVREMVLADKKLYLCYQKKDWSLDDYTREFVARQEVCEEIGSTPGKCLESARLAVIADGENYDTLAGSEDADDMAATKRYIKVGQQRYLAALHFEGLNNVFFSELKQEVHNGWIVHGTDTTPKTIEQTLQMCDNYRQKGRQYSMPIKSEDGVACVQQGNVSGPLLNRGGKPIKCFHCGENHHLADCPQIDAAKKKEIVDAKKKHWEDRNHKEGIEEAKKTTPGQAHM
jgi:uncharacterized protein CbrC (UPF0167 family)